MERSKTPPYRIWRWGGGIWIPDHTEQELEECMRDNKRFVECTSRNGGMAMYFPLCGPWHSSTRAEAGALILAAQINRPIHIGIDNKAVVDKSNQILRKATQLAQSDTPSRRRPFRRHWGLQNATSGHTFGSRCRREGLQQSRCPR